MALGAARVGWPRHRGASRLGWPCPSRCERQQRQVWASGDMLGSIGCRRCSMPSAARTSTNRLVGGRSQRMGAPSIDCDMGDPGTARPGGTPKHIQAHPSTSKHIQAHPSQAAALVPDEPRTQSSQAGNRLRGRRPEERQPRQRHHGPRSLLAAGCTCAIRARGPASLRPETPD